MILRKTYILLIITGFIFFSCKSTQSISNDQEEKKIQTKPKDNSELFIEASKQKILGNYDRATSLFLKCLELDPNDAASMYELAKLYTLGNQADKALEYSKKAAEKDGKNVYYLTYYGDLLYATKNYSEAAKVYENVVLLKPENPDFYNQLAAAYIYSGKPEKAIEVYDLLEEKAGITEEYSLKKQSIYLQQNKINKAIGEIETLIETFPLESKYYAILAEMCMNNGMEEKALEAYKKIAEINPDDPYIHISLADYYKKNGDLERSYEELKLGFLNPNLDIDTKVQILIQYYTVNEIYKDLKDEAFELAEILVEVHPDDPKAFSMYGDFLYQDEQFEAARDAFRNVIELDNSKYLVWEQLLFTESKLEDNESLLEESRQAIELFPEQPIPYLFAGGVLYQKKEWEESISTLEKGAYLVVNNNLLLAQFYAYLGDAYNQIDETAKSDEAYEKVLAINPDHDYVLNNYAYYLSLRGENLEKAAKMAKRATELRPNTPSNLDTYGWVLYKMGYYEEAKVQIEKAIENGAQDNPVILEHMGDVLWKLGNEDEALEHWIRAKDAGEGSEFLEQKIEEKELIE